MKNSAVTGVVLIGLGLLFLFSNLGLFDNVWGMIWPIFLLIPAMICHIRFFTDENRNPAVLVPGGTLLVLSLLFFYHSVFGWESSEMTWPFYIFAPAFGFLEAYVIGNGKKYFVPMLTLMIISVVMFLSALQIANVGNLWPIVLIVIGVAMILRKS